MKSDLHIKTFSKINDDCINIRTNVFVLEQGFKNEFDDIDNIAKHFVGYLDNVPVAVCRVYFSNQFNSYTIGRIAVEKVYRHLGYGKLIIFEAEKFIKAQGGTTSCVSAQMQSTPFYKHLGYVCEGNIYLDEYCPHILMKKIL